jgi:hypothetical protein
MTSVRLDELLERAHVAALRLQHELRLEAWTALHTATTPRLGRKFQRARYADTGLARGRRRKKAPPPGPGILYAILYRGPRFPRGRWARVELDSPNGFPPKTCSKKPPCKVRAPSGVPV